MMGAGYLVRTVGWGPASLATIPGGVLIFVAFRLARRRQPTTRDGTSESPAVSGVRTHLLKQPGLLEGLSLRSQFVILGLTMASGAVMVSAGFAWAAQSLISAAALAVLGGLFIAFGLITLLLPDDLHVFMLGAGFGGLHIIFGFLIGRMGHGRKI